MAEMNDTTVAAEVRLKRCNKCGIEKPRTEFWSRPQRGPDAVRSRCKACTNCPDYHAEYRKANKERIRDSKLQYYFGLTADEYENLSASQGHVCKICGGIERSRRYTRLCVDHCHTTKEIRGLLCNNCNRAIGLLGDSPERLRRAAEYLEQNRVVRVVAARSSAA